MTIDADKLRALLEKARQPHADLADEHFAYEELAHAAVVALPELLAIYEAASGLLDKARKCVDRPYGGCSIDHSCVESWLDDAIDAARGKR
jgi:hypothetical protein